MSENLIYSILFSIPLLIAVFFCISYSLESRRLDYSYMDEKSGLNASMLETVNLSIKKVNAWNKIVRYYAISHYSLNILSVVFTEISIFCALSNANIWAALASIVTALTLIFNLFLRCDRKWFTFRKVLAEGRILTNSFLVKISTFNNNAPNTTSPSNKPAQLVEQYANAIIKLEKSIEDLELI